MREKVQPGSHVVVRIEGPLATERPVNLEPPFDCLQYDNPMGPLPPGKYVVRFRYAGTDDVPDLATGTLTVRSPSPGSLTP